MTSRTIIIPNRQGEVYLPPYWITPLVGKEEGQRIGYGLKNFKIQEIHKKSTGEGVSVAIADTGIRKTHPDLVENIDLENSKSFAEGESDIEDDGNHGTHVAGIVAASNNQVGILGVAPKAKIRVVRVLGKDGSGSFKQVADGIDYAVDNKADIISMSLGASYPDPPYMKAAIQRAQKANIIVVCAAGNDGDNNNDNDADWPGRYTDEFDNVLSIGAVDINNAIAWFSSDGSVDVCAPGVDVDSCWGDDYALLSGTSMATPFVSGVIALMIELSEKLKVRAKLTAKMIKQILRATAVKKEPVRRYGKGLVNPLGSLYEVERLAI